MMDAIFQCLFVRNKIHRIGLRYYAKEIKFGNEGKNLLLKGAETLAKTVAVTLGPKAGSVIVDSFTPKISRDGLFVANSIKLPDQFENIGVQIMQKMAEATQKQVGNCTKTATVLAKEIAKQGYKRIVKGSNPVEIRKGIMDAVEVANKHLDEISRKLDDQEDIEDVACAFAEGDETIGKLVAGALTLVGKTGVITVRESEHPSEEAQLCRGMILETGYQMCNFPIEKRGRIKFENVLLVIYNRKIEDFRTIIPILELAVSKHRSLVILAEDISPSVTLSFAINNEAVIGVKFASAKIPGDKDFDKDILKDLAYTAGGRIYGDEACGSNWNQFDEKYFGEVPEIVLTKNEMIFIHSRKSDLLKEKVAELKMELEKTNNDVIKTKLMDRLNRLESNVAIITIDGSCDKEKVKNYKDKIYSVIESTRIAMEEGIVPGAGLALVRCVDVLNGIQTGSDDYKLGVRILSNSLTEPFNTIIKNSHDNPAPILCKLKDLQPNIGYDVVSESFVDVYEAGIVDPTKAVKNALKNAANAASLMVTSEAVVVYKFDGTEIVL